MKTFRTTTVPLEAQYLYQRGREMMERQMDEAALACFRQAVFIAPGFSKACRELGTCLARMGRTDEAAVYFLKASHSDATGNRTPIEDIVLQDRKGNNPAPGACLTFLIW
jgi:tetratricopeptide (TPR) repeat protein